MGIYAINLIKLKLMLIPTYLLVYRPRTILYIYNAHPCCMSHQVQVFFLAGFYILLYININYIYIMGSTGKLDVEVEVKSPADKYWHSIRDSTTVFPKACPDAYKTIEVLEGDGKSAGSVRLVQFSQGT